MTTAFTDPMFTDETAARQALESIRWPNGPVCVHCGAYEHVVRVAGEKQSHRAGLLYCNDCGGQFTVTVGTVFERSKIPLTKWWMATFLLCSSKKGISSHQIARTLGVTYKTAWFMTHRLREAMAPAANAGQLGGEGKTVEADETYLTRSKKTRKPKGQPKNAHPAPGVLSLYERGGDIRSMPIGQRTVRGHLVDHLKDDGSRLVTDGSNMYFGQADKHESVDHSKFEWARGDVHTNTLEGYFSLFKRGMVGTYQHCNANHLHRYLAEFDFRFNNRVKLGITDRTRTAIAMKGIEGKRLTYRGPDKA
jgi:transposase-like protein